MNTKECEYNEVRVKVKHSQCDVWVWVFGFYYEFKKCSAISWLPDLIDEVILRQL